MGNALKIISVIAISAVLSLGSMQLYKIYNEPDYTSYISQIAELEAENSEYEAMIESLGLERATLLSTIATLRTEKTALQSQLDLALADVDRLESDVESLRATNTGLTALLDEANATIGSLDIEISCLNDTIGEMSEDYVTLTAEKEQLAALANEYRTDIENLCESLDWTNAELGVAITGLENLNAQMLQLNSQLNTAQARIAELEDLLASANARIAELESSAVCNYNDYIFSGDAVIGYTGQDADIAIPSSYSIGGYDYHDIIIYEEMELDDLIYSNNLSYPVEIANGNGFMSFIDDMQLMMDRPSFSYPLILRYQVATYCEGTDYQVTSIGNLAFNECNSLKSLTLPDSVTSIEGNAFRGCSGLTSIIIPSSVTNIGDCAFAGCSGLTSIIIPSGVTSIGNSAFASCDSLINITIPSSVTYLGSCFVENCVNLETVNMYNSTNNFQCVDCAWAQILFQSCPSTLTIHILSTITDPIAIFGEYWNCYDYTDSSLRLDYIADLVA